MIRKRLTYCIGVFLFLLLASCGSNDRSAGTDAATYIPDAPDYADAAMWYIRQNSTADKGADVFYLVSTWETDWTTADGRVCHYADVHNATHRANMDKEISRIAVYMGEAGDFYSPYYRHITIEGWATLNEDTINNRFRIAFSDVQAAFNTFLRGRPDPDRPFVLAGFSQGGKAVVELLKTMPADAMRRLVQLRVRRALHPARGGSPLRDVHQPRELAHRCYARYAARHNHRQRLARAPRTGRERLQRLGIPAHPGLPQCGRLPQRRAVALRGMPAREHPDTGGGLL